MALADQWRYIERGLPDTWADARLLLTLDGETDAERAGALLGPLNPGRSGRAIRFHSARRGAGPAPEQVRRLLRRLDSAGINGKLELVSSAEAEPQPEVRRPTLVSSWAALAAGLPPDWSDIYAEIEIASTDFLERAALLVAPLNPARYGERPVFRFRAAHRFGYGASPGMVRRCLERLDEEGIRGSVRILRVLSDTKTVATQGPVWYVGGRAV